MSEKYPLIQVLEDKGIKLKSWTKNEDFIKRNPPFLEIRKIISIDSKCDFNPESSNLSVLCFNCYSGIQGIGEKDIIKALEFIDHKIEIVRFYKKFYYDSINLSNSKHYKNFIRDLYYFLCIESGYLPFSFPQDLNLGKEFLERCINFNPSEIKEEIESLNLPLLFKKSYEESCPRNPYGGEISKMGNSSPGKFLESIDLRFKGYKKQIIY